MENLESREDYLERILILRNQNGSVRSIDIANDMSFSKPSVSIAMKKLKEDRLISIDDKGSISLTKEGETIAQKIYERHLVLSSFFEQLGVDKETAHKDACKVEHDLSETTYQAIKNKLK